MSKRQPKAQASSTRAATAAFTPGFGLSSSNAFGTHTSQLSHVAEPPDLSKISDPNIVVCFRNLSKRDSTTKAKALEELQVYISLLETPVEDGVLEAWISIYPRTSIDNSKAVRQNAHILHGSIAASAGKRIAQFMSKCVAAWLCGLYDTDRSVVEATQNSLRLVFKTNAKIQNIRPLYQRQILEYCAAAIQNETPLTLSDERTISPDDAATKYSRLVSTCAALVGSLMSNLKPEDVAKYRESYDALLGDKKIWELGLHEDASIRRSVHRLLRTCLEKTSDIIESILPIVSKSYLASGLNSDQTGSAYDYIQTLTVLTSTYPTVWTENYMSKTPADRRLRQFLKKGSQFGPAEFWVSLVELFKALPLRIKPSNGADAAELLGALHGGISRKEEPKQSLEAAFGAYLDITENLCQSVPAHEFEKLLRELVLPMATQYLRPAPENSEWNLPSNAGRLVVKALSIRGMESVVRAAWPQYFQAFVDDIKTSAPEQSQDYKESQNSLITQASRVASLQQLILDSHSSEALQSAFSEACESIIAAAISVLKNRNGKPYGAAGVIKEFLVKNGSVIFSNKGLEAQVATFVRDDLPALILSASASQLLEVLFALPDTPAFSLAWDAPLKAVLSAQDSPTKRTILKTILTSPQSPKSVDLTRTELQDYIKSIGRSALEGSSDWESFSEILPSSSHIMSPATTDEILSSITKSLSLSEEAPRALQGLEEIVQRNPSMLKTYVSSDTGSSLLQTLLLASESPDDEIALKAAEVNASIQPLVGTGSDSRQAIFNVIHQNLRHASPESLSVETLLDLAKKLTESMGIARKASIDFEKVGGLFPRLQEWDEALSPYLEICPAPAWSRWDPLGGAATLIQSGSVKTLAIPRSRDRDGYSSVYRMAVYMIKLFDEGLFKMDGLPPLENGHYFRNIALTYRLADENFAVPGTNNLWDSCTPDWRFEFSNFSQDARETVCKALKPVQGEEAPLLCWALEVLSNTETDRSPRSYHIVDTAASVVTLSNIELDVTELQNQLKLLRKDDSLFPLLGFLSAHGSLLDKAKSCERMCNELVSGITAFQPELNPEEALPKLLTLNAIVWNQPNAVQAISKQRVIFLVRRVKSWLQNGASVPTSVRAAICQLLIKLLPLMSDIYGEHWGEILSALAASWQNAGELADNNAAMHSPLPYVTQSLELYSALRSLAESDDPNDDILDSWKERQGDLSAGLINLLKHAQDMVGDFSLPLERHIHFRAVIGLLSKELAKVPLEYVGSAEELYPLLCVESSKLQQTAFGILHKQIPAAQEQVSIDAALDKKAARMPEELLSLILDAPTDVDLTNESMALSLRGYLLSWLLVFDHFDNASFKVKNDYAAQLKEGNYLSALLDFTFEFLGHSRGKPIKFSPKDDITKWEEFPGDKTRMAQRLLANLYSLSLQHLPSLTKAWYIHCKSRPVSVSLQAWTEKYISPRVRQTALESVKEWARSQANEDPDSPFRVNVKSRALEIYAYYTFDEQTMSMRITLPPAYPLVQAKIEGITRFVVTEQKWQSWLHASRGAITIFNGSLIDALTTFRRNVDGAIKGHTECAICYSIVGPDKKVPDKRCAVCKNLFHGGCLFKWFKSSGSSTCPLCRTQISYG